MAVAAGRVVGVAMEMTMRATVVSSPCTRRIEVV